MTITRDDWGVPHIAGPTDADAVFGMIYAQAEDDFARIDRNYGEALGRLAAADGEAAIWSDLRARLYYGEARLRRDYARTPPWLKRLMVAWADGLNFYLARHPGTRPRYVARFEPWMPLAFSEGSIGGDIEDIDLTALRGFYGSPADAATALARPRRPEEQGSNGIAIAPARTAAGHALLLINPHTSFYFRSEAQVTSGEGLNAYGASTWGQFFVYQGFNASAGWMHTSSGIVRTARMRSRVEKRGGGWAYDDGGTLRPIVSETIAVPYRTAAGTTAERRVTVLRTRHGPVVASQAGSEGTRWISFTMMDRPVEALAQGFLRTKAADWAAFRRAAGYRANSSNDVLFADRRGTIAFTLPDHVPVRDAALDHADVIDGGDRRAGWTGLHTLDQIPHLVDPASGWVYNTNNAPWSAAGAGSLRADAFPRYMDVAGQNARGLHAEALLGAGGSWTPETLRAAAYDPHQPGFAAAIPPLVAAWDALPAADPLKARLAAPVAVLRAWDFRWGGASVAQSVAMFWGEAAARRLAPARTDQLWMTRIGATLSGPEQLALLAQATDRIASDFGTWRTPWGAINRFQRLTPAIDQTYGDAAPSVPVPFANGAWGSLAVVKSAPRAGTKRWYGDEGNSFVAVVEFGPRVKAQAVMAGGQSGDPASPHFFDQARRYGPGALRPVYFHADELAGHVARRYRPGQ